jgi:hypothetical protein
MGMHSRQYGDISSENQGTNGGISWGYVMAKSSLITYHHHLVIEHSY